MRLVIARVVAAPSTLLGYLRRYLFEIEAGVLVGSATSSVEQDLVRTLDASRPRGYLIVSDSRSAVGYKIAYFDMPGTAVIDVDGIQLIERSKKSES